ncbi:hypothetical protein O181_044624 [Austropuccinia psidii MF-1]|uniref:Uncharacterized protein n=1 Tax=Austropuccinia psidii MF-1 TaxID=1389203 RepID=A0A9Q3HJK3_9BASI|nr:hypothetical protein [Austropuccinia psidii MF-1]
MLMPLMMILQQEQERMKQARDEEREMLCRDHEEERRLWEVQIQAEDKHRSDQMQLYMMTMLSNIAGIPLHEPPAHLQNGSGSGSITG